MAESKQSETTFTVDETDKDVLNELLKDPRKSYRDIAKAIRKSPATVMNRIKNLEKEKIIKGYTTLVDYDRLGYDLTVIIDIRIAKGNLHKVEKKFAFEPNVLAVYDNTGHFDATIIGRFKNRKTMDGFLKRIQKDDFVERTETKLVLKTLKEEPTLLR